MSNRILVATDLSESSIPALELGIALAVETHATIELLYVIDTSTDPLRPLPNAYEAASEEWTRQLAAQADAALRKRATPPKEPLEFIYRTSFGDPAREILSVADQEQVELIVLSTHTRSRLQHLRLGSVTAHVVRGAHVPVLTVRTGRELPTAARQEIEAVEVESSVVGEGAPTRILAAIDLDEEALPVLREAGRQAARLNARLSVLYVAEVGHSVIPILFNADAGLDVRLQLGHRASDALSEFLVRHVDQLPETVMNARRLVAIGDAVKEINTSLIQHDIGMLVIGRRKQRGLRGYLGSVTERLMQSATCPVLVVPALEDLIRPDQPQYTPPEDAQRKDPML